MAKGHRFPSAVASGQLPLPADGPVGVLNAHRLPGLDALSDLLVCEQGFRPEHDHLVAAGFRAFPVIEGRFNACVVLLGRHRKQNRANIARALQMLQPGGILVLDGQKTAGVESLLREVKKFLPMDQTLSRDHGKLAWTPPLDGTFCPPDTWNIEGQIAQNDDGFLTAPGMFSARHVDTGSHKLAQYFDRKLKGRVADLGAGWGWLAAACLKKAPAITACDLYEADHASLQAARKNVSDPRAGFHWADVATLQDCTECYNLVVSNPPFHQGRAAEPDLGIAFVAAAARILKSSGTALFVANRQLPYESAFETHFADWTVLEQDSAFKVIRARRPRGQVAIKRYRARI